MTQPESPFVGEVLAPAPLVGEVLNPGPLLGQVLPERNPS